MTADELVALVRSRGAIPSTTKITDQAIIDAANEQLIELQADAIRANSELLTVKEDVPCVAGQAEYNWPVRSAGATARVVTYVDTAGVESKPLLREELQNIGSYSTTPANPVAFYLLDGQIVLMPPPIEAGSLRLRYSRTLSPLVLDSLNGSSQHTAVATIASVTDATHLVCAAAHSGFLSNLRIDITQGKPPHRLLAKDVLCGASAAGTGILLTGIDATTLGIVAGDLVTLARTTSVPQLPREWHSLLLLRTVRQMQAQAKDYKALSEVSQNATILAEKVAGMEQPRTAQNPKRISAWRGRKRGY